MIGERTIRVVYRGCALNIAHTKRRSTNSVGRF